MDIGADTAQMEGQGGKKEWADPEIVVLSVNENTLGAALINDDGGGFSS